MACGTARRRVIRSERVAWAMHIDSAWKRMRHMGSGLFTPGHLVVLLILVLILGGAKKLPEMARSLGQSARVLKSELKGMQADDEARAKTSDQPTALPQGSEPEPPARARPVEGTSTTDSPS